MNCMNRRMGKTCYAKMLYETEQLLIDECRLLRADLCLLETMPNLIVQHHRYSRIVSHQPTTTIDHDRTRIIYHIMQNNT
jgi:hypothetical protein